MPNVELLPVPSDPKNYKAYLLNNFRRIADTISRVALKHGAEDIEITDSASGVILSSPNGTRYRIIVDNAGALSTELA